ncbi:hypothetical protein N0B51_14710, partial [Tsuneonella sp. YG55]
GRGKLLAPDPRQPASNAEPDFFNRIDPSADIRGLPILGSRLRKAIVPTLILSSQWQAGYRLARRPFADRSLSLLQIICSML